MSNNGMTARLFLCALFACSLTAGLSAEKEDQSKLSYEAGVAYALAGEGARARAQFEKAAQVQGDFADLARIELLRISARDGKTALPALLQTLGMIKDQTLLERAHLHLAGSLVEARRFFDAIDVALLFAGKFPESDLADDALLLSSRVFLRLGRSEASRMQAAAIVSRYSKSDSVDAAREILARLSLMPDESYNPVRACAQWDRIAAPGGEIHTVIEPPFSSVCPP